MTFVAFERLIASPSWGSSPLVPVAPTGFESTFLKYSITSLCLLLYCRRTAYNHAAFSILKHILLHHLSLFFQFLRQFLNFIHSADSACCYSTKLGFIAKKRNPLTFSMSNGVLEIFATQELVMVLELPSALSLR